MYKFSRQYYPTLSDKEHDANDVWFDKTIRMLRDKGVKGIKVTEIPNGPKYFSTYNGEEVDKDGKPIEKFDTIIANGITGEWFGFNNKS